MVRKPIVAQGISLKEDERDCHWGTKRTFFKVTKDKLINRDNLSYMWNLKNIKINKI